MPSDGGGPGTEAELLNKEQHWYVINTLEVPLPFLCTGLLGALKWSVQKWRLLDN